MTRPIRTLLFSTLYPSSAQPLRGVFVETRLRELLATGRVQTKVVAPVPWFPSTDRRYGKYAEMAAAPAIETHNGIEVRHPRYVVLPKIGMNVTPFLLALSARPAVAALLHEGWDFDVIDAHYYYPDGVAAAMLARWFGRPLAITARGTDLSLIPRHWWPRTLMQWAAKRADASIGVCNALVDVLRRWRVDEAKLHVFRNGVDLQRFRPLDPVRMRADLGLRGEPLLLCVGNMKEEKGQNVAIEALAALTQRFPGASLVLVGDGETRPQLERQARVLGVADRVVFAGVCPNAELLRWYSAADALLLCSSREGWPNVLLESMACGTPVVATATWGIPEVLNSPVAGRLVLRRDGGSFAQAVCDLLSAGVDRAGVRRYAEGFSWERTSENQVSLFERLMTKT